MKGYSYHDGSQSYRYDSSRRHDYRTGAPNVLIGNLPACRMGDTHLPDGYSGCSACSSLVVLWQVVVQRSSSRVFLRLDRRRVYVSVSLKYCIGVPYGTHRIWCSGGNGGGSGTFASIDNTVKALKEGKIKPVEGTETFPVEIQAAIAQISRSCSKETVTQKIKAIEELLPLLVNRKKCSANDQGHC